ncbi:MAG: DUF4271 domain-containing protein [Flavobacteriales bacterium]|nr:DUF4271 domain-containing protein [Flavobacteriales bacterium]
MEFYLSISSDIIPNELIPRSHSTGWLMGYALFASFIALSVARFAREEVFQGLILANMKFKGVVSFVKETMPLGKPSSLMLMLNYVLASGVICYFFYIQHFDEGDLGTGVAVFLLPLALLFWNILCFVLTGWISGAAHILTGPIALKVIGAQFLGLFYFVLAIMWLFSAGEASLFGQLALLLFFVESFFRIVKSANLVLKQGVSWYYLILYFCTLEILPLLMIYIVLTTV